MRQCSFVVLVAALAAGCLLRPPSAPVARPTELAIDQLNPAPQRASEGVRAPQRLVQANGGGGSSSAEPELQVDPGPHEYHMTRATPSDDDLHLLPPTPPDRIEREEREEPFYVPTFAPGTTAPDDIPPSPGAGIATLNAPAPGPSASFEGLDFHGFGNGHPPDTNGDVGPQYYIQTINTSIGIFRKSDGVRVVAFSFNTFMSQGHFGNVCDTNNFGDPVVLYDTFEDRWVITDFAFLLSGGAVVNPPGAFQCFAVSKTGDPISGGWNFYSINTAGGLGDYPKFGIWPDGIYMSANMFGFPAGAPFQGSRVYAFNKAQMYAGAADVQVVSFDVSGNDFTVLPSNARLQTGTPPPGTPNYYVSTWLFLNALTVYKFHVDWSHISLSSFTGPDIPLASSSWPNASVPPAPSLGGNNLDVLPIRAMMQNQYSNIDGVESLWATHTVRRANTTGVAAPRWYQVNVTGGAVAPGLPQATTWDPDGANVIHRFMPSLAVDRSGNLAIGYSTSSSSTKPAIKYAGRLATDPANTFSLTEQVLIQGAGTQTGNCGGAACTRWGDYSAMTLDPDGCTFWYTNMYYEVDGLNHHTRIGSIDFGRCTPLGSGSLQGTVKTPANVPIEHATVALGSRTTFTDANGQYSFPDLPAGTYPAATASFPGYSSQTVGAIVVNASATTTQNFTLTAAAATGCFVDTTQADFQAGVPANCDLSVSPGDVVLASTTIDQQNTLLGNSGFNVSTSQWIGQNFTPSVSGALQKVDVNMFCSICSGANPPVTVEIRTVSGGVPTTTVLASTTIAGFSSGSATYYSATFASPAILTANTQYALLLRLVTARAGNYNATFSTANPYPGGVLVFTVNGGAAFGSIAGDDLGFKTYMPPRFGNFVSSMKDANPTNGATPRWGTIAWTASAPGGTGVQLQVAGSNSPLGPFAFVGPDGTGASFFTNGGSLSQFDGSRYLKYKASLSTPNTALTPALNDVTICFNDVPGTTMLAASPAAGTYGGTTTLAATLNAAGAPLSGQTISFTLGGTPVGSASTDATGTATLDHVSLGGFNAGTYPDAVGASFAGTPGYAASNASNALTVDPLAASVTPNPASKIYGDGDPVFTGTLSGFLDADAVTAAYGRTPGESVAGSPYTISATLAPASVLGNYAITYNTAPFTITPRGGASVTPNAAGKTYGDPDPALTGTVSGFLPADGVTAAYGRTPGETVAGSPYSISATLAPAAVLGNYSITYNTAPFTIGRAPLTAKADDKTKIAGEPNPVFTGTVTGIKLADPITATYSSPAITTSPAGLYPIVPLLVDPASRLDNYTVQLVNGTLTAYAGPLTGSCLDGPTRQLLSPVDPLSDNVFNQGRTVPVKFRVCDGSGRSIDDPGLIKAFRLVQVITSGGTTNVDAAPASTNGQGFRFDPTDQQWIFNLSTKPLPAGATYVYRITLVDATTIEFRFGLR